MRQPDSKVSLSVDAINPVVINSYLFSEGMQYKKGELLPKRQVRTYELEFFLESEGGMTIDEHWYAIKPGDIVFRKPGEYTQAQMPYSCYAIYFDMNNSLTKENHPLDTCSKNNPSIFQKNYDNEILNVIPSVFKPVHPDAYGLLFKGVIKHFIQPDEVCKLASKAQMLQILFDIYNEIQNSCYMLDKLPNGNLIKKTLDYIHNHIDKPIHLNDLAGMVNLSPNYYHVLFKNVMHQTPYNYINALRMKKAKELLVFTNQSVNEISDQCGFVNAAYFSHYFKKLFNTSPTDYRSAYRLHNVLSRADR